MSRGGAGIRTHDGLEDPEVSVYTLAPGNWMNTARIGDFWPKEAGRNDQHVGSGAERGRGGGASAAARAFGLLLLR
jgi:hypothetical protein